MAIFKGIRHNPEVEPAEDSEGTVLNEVGSTADPENIAPVPVDGATKGGDETSTPPANGNPVVVVAPKIKKDLK